MPRPVVSTIDVPQPRADVYGHLDVLANHEAFTDHLLKDWEVSGPPTGVGARARVHVKALGVTDVVDIEVTEVDAPQRITERNVAQKAGRTAEGTYTLAELPDGGTRITFEYRWVTTPLVDRLTAPIARAVIRRTNDKAMLRLAAQLV